MNTIDEDIQEFHRQLQHGATKRAYQKILSFMTHLRRVFAEDNQEVSSLYQGIFTITYFAVFPAPLKSRDLKMGVVFNYETFQFEVWLLARNRTIQTQFRNSLYAANFTTYALVDPALNPDAIIVLTLVKDFSFHDEDRLTQEIVDRVRHFEQDIVEFLETL